MVRRVHRAKSFSFDLLADWRPYADPPAEGSEWVYYGTATLNSQTGALAWSRRGRPHLAIRGQDPIELGLWERIELQNAVEFKRAPGWEGVPRWPLDRGEPWAR
jgi:hypothetical protein